MNGSWYAIILLRKRDLLALLCVVALYVLFLFLTMPWVGLQSVIVAFPGHILTFYLSADVSNLPSTDGTML